MYKEDTSLSLSEKETTVSSSSVDDCEFSVYFEPQENFKKSTNWTYSEIKEKLYVSMAVACPIRFKVKKLPPDGTIIRATPVFISSEFREDVAKRCLIHSSPSDVLNVGHPAPEHLIRCDNGSAQYVECPFTKRLSVTVPYESPKVGMDHSLYIYRFMCLGSCVGGLNRRALQIIFTLEKDNHCLGQRILNIRICACPGRDRRLEEKRQLKQHTPKTVPKLVSSSSSEETFVIPKQHHRHIERVRSILDVFNFADLLTDQQKATLRDMKLQRLSVRPSLSKHNSSCSSSSGNKYDLMNKLFKKSDSAKTRNQATVSPPKINLSKYSSLNSWLSSFGLVAYSDKFREHNFTSMEQLHNFTLMDLKKLRIGKAHSEKIWEEVIAYKKETSRCDSGTE
ncbi:cellular tumor antigen p53-like [Centruroides vittatus]|uniref:cellular tumor antigen p53-like n=1 Tax=Centruroides vittatus TaxID=120091 RepID=UPI00350F72F4